MTCAVWDRPAVRGARRAHRPHSRHAQVRAKKEAVVEWKRKDILGLKRPEWNASTDVGEKLCVRKLRVLGRGERDQYRYNYRSEVLPAKEPAYAPRTTKFEVQTLAWQRDPAQRAMMAVAARRVSRPGWCTAAPRSSAPMRPQSICRTQEMPINPKLDGKPGWQGTAQFDATSAVQRVRPPQAAPSWRLRSVPPAPPARASLRKPKKVAS